MREPGRLTRPLADEAATRAAGAELAAALQAAGCASAFITVAGELGAGKTTLVRGLLGALGVAGPVRSPTFTLIESYPVGPGRVHHLDWYRLAGPEELEGLGFRELLGSGQWVLAEWPERAPDVAAQADLALALRYAPVGRELAVTARTATGQAVLSRWMRGNA
ncbi:MAG TPA: tRNA (adenosine(37)-N6)-threonylcarbamoyltransferase complex ATPase subunit type 1 TsaE [Steroidobacteraceae bacterium]|nr:tRNA (adenosine(37)-N6)-threonylcarbamoyltransferase complex ATPase subunit type 1 TsaE [Steroidobacteraceae bacterium]